MVHSQRVLNAINWVIVCLGFVCVGRAATIPGPEKLLPDDTLLFVTVPDFQNLRTVYRQSPPVRFVNDAAMKPFVEKFLSKAEEDFLKPLEHELNQTLGAYAGLLRGQLTFAVTQNGWQGKDDNTPGLLLLLDTRDASAQLTADLAEFQQKWLDAGKMIRFEQIRGIEFLVLSLSGDDIPKTLSKYLPRHAPTHELGEPEHPNGAWQTELVIGRVDSLLLIGTSARVVEKVVVQLTGGTAPTVGDLAAYRDCSFKFFRTAPLYAWVNARSLVEILSRSSEKKENPLAPNPFDPRWDRLLAASGSTGLRSVAISIKNANDGLLFELFLGIPQPGRQGMLKILAGESRDTSPPPFVPADAISFQRWRLDLPRAWAALEKMGGEIQMITVLRFLLDSAAANAKLKDPAFDIKQALLGNLGNDFITYEKAGHGSSSSEREPPWIALLGCQHGEQVSAALKGIFSLVNQGGGASEREFLGRKIFTVSLQQMALPLAENGRPQVAPTLIYAVSGGYVAFSSDPSMIEEYLRSSESGARALRENPILLEDAEKVGGPGTGLFGCENQVETMRATFEALKAGSPAAPPASHPILAALNLNSPEASIKDWMDFSLLPPFDKVSKYFSFSAYAGSSSVEGLTFKIFFPTPPQLRSVPEWANSNAVQSR